MTPGVPLAGFCATMAAIAVWRLASDQRRDYIEIGSTLVVVGVALLSAAWAVTEVAPLGVGGPILLAVSGIAVVAAGVAVMVRHWNERRNPTPTRD